jgi:hypothetical protein
MRRVDGSKHYPEHLQLRREEHDDGEILSGALYHAFQDAGLEPVEGYRLAVESLFDYSTTTSFGAAAEAVLEADRQLTGGRHAAALRRSLIWSGLISTPSQPVQVDESRVLTAEVRQESPHPIANGADASITVTQPGATALRVHYSAFSFRNGDNVYIYDGQGRLYQIETGNAGAHSSAAVPGDTVTVRWVSNSSSGSAGFTIDRRHASAVDRVMALPRYLMSDHDRGAAFERLLSDRATGK